MATTSVDFAKIGSTPTSLSWSQSYHAGKLFAVVSLTKTPEAETEEPLSSIGKAVVAALEEEYFTLEEKSFSAIKGALETVLKNVPTEINTFFSCGTIIPADNTDVLYLFLKGQGSAILKRGQKLITLLKNAESLEGISGFLEDNDLIVIQSQAFEEAIPQEILKTTLSKPHPEIPEAIAPILQQKEENGACASVIALYRSSTASLPEPHSGIPSGEAGSRSEGQSPKEEIVQPIQEHKTATPQIQKKSPSFKLPHLKLPFSRRQRVILVGVCILLVILVFSINSTMQNKKSADASAKAQETLAAASKKYEEGQALVELNKPLANEEFLAAKKILEDGRKYFSADSTEYKQLIEMFQKIDSQASEASGISNAQVTPADANKSPLLSYEQSAKETAFAQDEKTIYAANTNAVNAIDKETDKSKEIIKNESDWTTPLGIGTFLGNIYILDKENVLKYVQGDSGYGKSTYFTADKPDLSSAQALGIDGSVYILFKDGSIAKFTRGKAESFNLSGLDKTFKNATKIVTDADMDNLYILDNENSRIIVLNKTGAYQSQYQASILKNAKDIDVLEGDKKIYILSGGKIWQIDLK